jgi:hypothetical protein
LEAFLQLHSSVHGQRWKCTNCELFLSLKDLEYCELTEYALNSLKDKITSDRHMVEVREDRHMQLMPAQRSRAERDRARNARKKKAQGNNRNGNNNGNKGEPEIIEID